MIISKTVLTREEWRPLTISVGGRFEINLHSTLEPKMKEHNPYFI
jgi:hypothetical protein